MNILSQAVPQLVLVQVWPPDLAGQEPRHASFNPLVKILICRLKNTEYKYYHDNNSALICSFYDTVRSKVVLLHAMQAVGVRGGIALTHS
jgi:hypothetical protein